MGDPQRLCRKESHGRCLNLRNCVDANNLTPMVRRLRDWWVLHDMQNTRVNAASCAVASGSATQKAVFAHRQTANCSPRHLAAAEVPPFNSVRSSDRQICSTKGKMSHTWHFLLYVAKKSEITTDVIESEFERRTPWRPL